MKNLMNKILWVALISTLANASAFAFCQTYGEKDKNLPTEGSSAPQQPAPAPAAGAATGGSQPAPQAPSQ